MSRNRLGQILHEEEPDTRCCKCGTILIQVIVDPDNGSVYAVTRPTNMSDIVMLLCQECSSFRVYNYEPNTTR